MNYGRKPRGKGYKIDDLLKTVRPLEPGEQRAMVKMAKQELNTAQRIRDNLFLYQPELRQAALTRAGKHKDRGMAITAHLQRWGTVTNPPAGPRLAR